MKKIKKYLVFAVALFSLFLVNTKAEVLTSSSFDLSLYESTLPLTKYVSANSSFKGTIFLNNFSMKEEYSFLLFDACINLAVDSSNFIISNTGYNAYFLEESVKVYKMNDSCYVNSNAGVHYRVQIQVGGFKDSEGDGLNASSYLTIKNNKGYNSFWRFYSPQLSSVDVLTSLINSSKDSEKQQEIIDEQKKTNSKLDDVKSKQDEAETTRKGILATVKDVLSNIINLPKKIVEFLVDALKSLFVPTDDQLYEIVNDSKELSENFGFVGEAVAFFLNIFTSLLGMVNANGCVTMPAFKIGATSLFDEHTFWEARQVCLADNAILSANIDTIRTITSIVFVSLFLGFAASKFFGILSKNDSGSSTTYDGDGNASTTEWSRVNGHTSIYRR